MIEDQVMISQVTADVRASIGDVVELVELFCLAIQSTPREGGKNGGRIQDTVGELIGVTIRTRFETNCVVSACENAEAFGKASTSPFWSVRNKKPGKLFQ